jgi:phosphonate transport system substrate-binding protein
LRITLDPHAFVLGAVAYDPKVVTIWEGFRAWFRQQGFPLDYVLFSNYERQVEAHLAGVIDVAWNSPLAWIEAERMGRLRGRQARAIAMRDTDCDLTSVVVVRAGSALHSLHDLAGATVAVGALDSPQATLLPLLHLARESGLVPGEHFVVRRNDVMVGLHGDHVGGERDAARQLMSGEVDAACMIDGNHLAFSRDGTFMPGSTRILTQTPAFDHCNFTVFDGVDEQRCQEFTELLLGQRYDDPTVRPLLDLEGLKAWRPGRVSGYKMLDAAVDAFGLLDELITRR